MLKVSVKDSSLKETLLELNQQKDQLLIHDELFDGDIVKIYEGQYHVIWKNRSFSIEVIEADPATKSFRLLINGQIFNTSAKDEFDLLLEGLGMQAGTAQKINHIKAPMPGLIQSVMINEGDEVQKGDALLVLVAMKMENAIRATGSGIVKSLKIVPGQIVEKGQVLLEFL
jgi:biotin carboxyl carrier protein